MKNVIIALIMVFSIQVHAGLKGNVGLDTYEGVSQSNGSCTSTYVGGSLVSKECDSKLDKKRVQTVRLSLGYDLMFTEKYGIEALVGVDSLTNAQAELNVLYKIDDKITAKAGLNTSKDLSNGVLKNMTSGTGAQAGAIYKLTEKMDLFGAIGVRNQSYEVDLVPGSKNSSTIFGSSGISFRF